MATDSLGTCLGTSLGTFVGDFLLGMNIQILNLFANRYLIVTRALPFYETQIFPSQDFLGAFPYGFPFSQHR